MEEIATTPTELLLHIRNKKCRIYRSPDYATERDKLQLTVSQEYVVEYFHSGTKLYIHTHIDDRNVADDMYDPNTGSTMSRNNSNHIHVKTSRFGNTSSFRFVNGKSFVNFLKLAGVIEPFIK